jgi:hypothetical protein
MTNTETHLMPRRTPHGRPERDSTMTKIDRLIDTAKKLKEARTLAERCSDRALLYFIDMTIAHVCDSLDERPDAKSAAGNEVNPVHAAA